jgi:uncharacterized protein YcbK (DUF882 family)
VQLTKNFVLNEFEKGDTTPAHLVHNMKSVAIELQKARNIAGFPFFITSGYRGYQQNIDAGGSADSFHKKALAADLKIQGITGPQMYKFFYVLMDLGYIKNGGLIQYYNRIHYDIGPRMYRHGEKPNALVTLLITIIIKLRNGI